MKEELERQVAEACKTVFDVDISIDLTRPEEQFGDYATNAALQLSKQLQKNPREIAETLAVKLRENLSQQISDVSVAGPGFINIKLSDRALLEALKSKPGRPLDGQTIVAEYSDPNPFKALHAGHLYTSVVGDAIATLLEHAGATVQRVNFGGDVGLHVAKSMWGITRELGGEKPKALQAVGRGDLDFQAGWLAKRYVEGHEAYENNPEAKQEIIELNKKVYALHEAKDHDSPFAQIYWTCRQWSYDYFTHFYETIGVQPFRYYPESETAPRGVEKVKELLERGILQESDGAVVFKGEDHNLHTRVFLTKEGLPTYETKDLGLIFAKYDDYHFDKSIIITGNDIIEYMKVVLKVVEQVAPELARATTHLTHGLVRLAGGEKMSSRKGNVVGAVDIIASAAAAARKTHTIENKETEKQVVFGAVKYAFLKNRMGGDTVYDPEESVSLEGNSGPYLQYAHTRARSILRKAEAAEDAAEPTDLEEGERSLVRKITEYPETIDKAVAELMPHHVCTYLYELAQVFNRFYEHNRVIGDTRQATRLFLVKQYADTLKTGLELLGIAAPEQM
ncbi:MAG TPA: arginine--tRNA ligase [Candidatus Saccharimonadales bacterium]